MCQRITKHILMNALRDVFTGGYIFGIRFIEKKSSCIVDPVACRFLKGGFRQDFNGN